MSDQLRDALLQRIIPKVSSIGPADPRDREIPIETPQRNFMELLNKIFDPMGADTGPLKAVTLLSKGQMLNNILNHIDDLKGTPYAKAAEALAEKSPHVLGSVGKINLHKPPPYSGLDKMPSTALGAFWTNPIHELSGMVRKGFDVGNITLNPGLLARVFSNPNKVLGHEVTHAAQALGKNPSKFDEIYQANKPRYEASADFGGLNLHKLIY